MVIESRFTGDLQDILEVYVQWRVSHHVADDLNSVLHTRSGSTGKRFAFLAIYFWARVSQ